MMHPLLFALLMLIPMQYLPTHSTQSPGTLPTVSISLPADVPSETVQIRYFMTGSFGGYGGFIEPRPNQTDYEIDASTQGTPSDSIKILAYATGCKFQTFDLDLVQMPNPKVRLDCAPLPQIRIDGEIPSALMRHETAELNGRSIAFWARRFFGIAASPVTELHVA